MKKIITLLRKDFSNSFRDKMVVYTLVFPIILAIIARFFIPIANSTEINLFIDNSISIQQEENLSEFFNVRRTENYDKLTSEVLKYGNNPGLIFENGIFKIILQGNEPRFLIDSIFNVLIFLESNNVVDSRVVSLGIEESFISNIIISLVLILIIGLVGFSVGFSIIEDKETKMIEGLSVAPITLKDYVLSKILYLFIISFIFTLLAYLIMVGFSFKISGFLLTLFVANLMGIFLSFFIGTFSDNQTMGIAVSKIAVFVFCMLPVLSTVLSDNIQKFFYILPGYWVIQSFFISFMNQEGSLSINVFIASISHLLAIIIMIPKMRQNFRLRLK